MEEASRTPREFNSSSLYSKKPFPSSQRGKEIVASKLKSFEKKKKVVRTNQLVI